MRLARVAAPKNRANGRHWRPTASGFAAPIATARCRLRDRDAGRAPRPACRSRASIFTPERRTGGGLRTAGVVPISGAVITLDALHTTRNTTVSIVEQHGADYLADRQGECSETYEALASIAVGAGRCRALLRGIRRRAMAYRPAPYRGAHPARQGLNFAHVAQVFRVPRERTDLKSGEYSVEYAYGITSLAAESATPKQLLALESRPLGDRVEEPSSPRPDPLRRRLYGA